MFRTLLYCLPLLLVLAPPVRGEDAAATDDKKLAGMSIVGNDEAPKSLVIVPWKSAEMGNPLDVSRALDDGRQPVDRDVFKRELEYYEIRSASREPSGSGTQ